MFSFDSWFWLVEPHLKLWLTLTLSHKFIVKPQVLGAYCCIISISVCLKNKLVHIVLLYLWTWFYLCKIPLFMCFYQLVQWSMQGSFYRTQTVSYVKANKHACFIYWLKWLSPVTWYQHITTRFPQKGNYHICKGRLKKVTN